MRSLQKRVPTRTSDRGSPGLLIKLHPRRIYLMAQDLEEERELQGIARVVLWLLDVLERKAAA